MMILEKKIMLICIIQIDNKYFFNYSSFFLVYFWILSSKINNSDGIGCEENQNKVIWIKVNTYMYLAHDNQIKFD